MYLIEPRLYCVRVKIYINLFLNNKKQKNIGYCHILIENEVFQSYWVKRADGFEF